MVKGEGNLLKPTLSFQAYPFCCYRSLIFVLVGEQELIENRLFIIFVMPSFEIVSFYTLMELRNMRLMFSTLDFTRS